MGARSPTRLFGASFVAVASLPLLVALVPIAACGETRHAPGEACLRGDDCLSGYCTDRTCVAAPPLGNAPGGDVDAGGSPVDGSGSSGGDGASADARGD